MFSCLTACKFKNTFTLCNMNLTTPCISCADNIIRYNNDFYTLESLYNNRRLYDFGLIPYHFAYKIMNKNNIDDIVNDYINYVDKHDRQHYTYKTKVLLIHILATLSQTTVNTDSIDKDINTLNIINSIYDLFEKNKYIGIFNVCNIVNKQYTDLVVRVYIDINNITYKNIDSCRSILGDYYNIAVKYIDNDIQSYKDMLNASITKHINSLFKALRTYNLTLPTNVEQQFLRDNLTPYEVYIYTSFLIHPLNLTVTKDNYHTILLTNVYDDIINYTIFKSFVDNSDWTKWTLCKTVADNVSICCYQRCIYVINVAKFIARLKLRKVDPYVINTFNINTQYIIVDSTTCKIKDLDTCVDNIFMLFKSHNNCLYSQYIVNNKKIIQRVLYSPHSKYFTTIITE